MNTAFSLRFALMGNALFSFSSGMLLLFAPSLVGEWLGIQASIILQAIGIGLIVFAAELIYQATRKRILTWRALIASAADFMWVVGSIIVLLVFPQLFSSFGKTLLLAVASVVFVFGVWQLLAAGRTHRIKETGEYRHCIIVETNAPADKMWRIVGNIGNIKKYMPSLKHSYIMDNKNPGVGAVRTCKNHAGKQWSEECIEFNPGRSFTVRFLSEDPEFPFPAKTMRGGWEVTPSDSGSQVMVWWELTPKSKLLAPVILPLLAFQVDRDFPKIIKRMSAEALIESNETQIQNVFVRLLPGFC